MICGCEVEATLEKLDECRRMVQSSLSREFRHLAFDVIFTRDPHWVAASVGTSNAEEIGDRMPETGQQETGGKNESAAKVDPAPHEEPGTKNSAE